MDRKKGQLYFGISPEEYRLEIEKLRRRRKLLDQLIEKELVRQIKKIAADSKTDSVTILKVRKSQDALLLNQIKSLIYEHKLFKGSFNNLLAAASLKLNRKPRSFLK